MGFTYPLQSVWSALGPPIRNANSKNAPKLIVFALTPPISLVPRFRDRFCFKTNLVDFPSGGLIYRDLVFGASARDVVEGKTSFKELMDPHGKSFRLSL